MEDYENRNIKDYPYCGAKILIKNSTTEIPYLVCPGCGFSVEDKSGRKVEPAKTCSSCSGGSSDCHS